MRVVIADDESLVRASLRSMLEELELPVSIVGEAANGKETLALVQEYEPDLVLIDIQMPKLNGLGAIESGKKLSPQTSWIILTGFSEFNYAREAIRLGADNYLLKPVSPEELEEALQGWLKKHEKHKLFRNSQFENQMIALAHGLSSIEDTNNQDTLMDTAFLCSTFFIDSHLEEKQKADILLQFSLALRQCAYRYIGGDAKIAIYTRPTGEVFTVGCWKYTKQTAGKTKIQEYFGEINEMIIHFSNENAAITAIQSADCSSFEDFQQQINKILDLSALRTIGGIHKKWGIEQLSAYQTDSHITELSCILIQLSDYYKAEIYLNYMKTVTDFEKALLNAKLSKQSKAQICLFLHYALGCSLQAEEDVNTWIQKLQHHGSQLLAQNQKNENRQTDLVDQAIAFIDQNYMNNIGVGQIAEQLNVTPNYLSTLFHKKTGITFTKYIMKTRILKAKELLLNDTMQVQQVAEAVGYYSTRHFTKLFTEFVGCYPSEFRNQFKMENTSTTTT